MPTASAAKPKKPNARSARKPRLPLRLLPRRPPRPGEEPRAANPRHAAPRAREEAARDDDRRAKPSKTDDRGNRRSGKLTISQALSGGEGGRQRSLAAMRRAQEKERRRAMGGAGDREKIVRDVQVPEAITVQELANRMWSRR